MILERPSFPAKASIPIQHLKEEKAYSHIHMRWHQTITTEQNGKRKMCLPSNTACDFPEHYLKEEQQLIINVAALLELQKDTYH